MKSIIFNTAGMDVDRKIGHICAMLDMIDCSAKQHRGNNNEAGIDKIVAHLEALDLE